MPDKKMARFAGLWYLVFIIFGVIGGQLQCPIQQQAHITQTRND